MRQAETCRQLLLGRGIRKMIIPVNLDEKYDVIVENGALDDVEKYFNLNRKVLVLTDDGVPETYAEKVAKKCENPVVVTLKHGEESKTSTTSNISFPLCLKTRFQGKIALWLSAAALSGISAASPRRVICAASIFTTCRQPFCRWWTRQSAGKPQSTLWE